MKFLENLFKENSTPKPPTEVPTEVSVEDRSKNQRSTLAVEDTPQRIHAESSPISKTPQEIILETKEKRSSKTLKGGSNETIFIQFQDDGDGIFKPKSGEREDLRTGIEAGTYYKRERAAYLVDRFLGFNLVPPTVIRSIDNEEGSAQQFIPGAEQYINPEDQRYADQLTKMWIFDYIVWNSDRNSSNFLNKDGRLWAIDHGLCFGPTYLNCYRDMYEEAIPAEIIENIQKFLSWEEGKKILYDLLAELLDESEVRACFARIKFLGKLLAQGAISKKEAELNINFNPD